MKRIVIALFTLVSMVALAGCGGSSSSSSSSGGEPFAINSSTAADVALMVEDLGSLSGDFEKMVPLPNVKVGITGTGSNGLAFTPAGPMVSAVMDLMNSNATAAKLYTANSSPSFTQTVYDQCGDGDGSATLAGSWTDNGATFTATFVNYTPNCESYLNGVVTVVYDETLSGNELSFTFSGFSIYMGGEDDFTISMSGTIEVVETAGAVTFTANYTVTDGVDSASLTNFVIDVDTSEEPSLTYTVDGQMGWNGSTMTITNLVEIYWDDAENDDHPTSGSYIIDGPGKLKVTYVDATHIRLDGDFDENGSWEWTTGDITWEAFYDMID